MKYRIIAPLLLLLGFGLLFFMTHDMAQSNTNSTSSPSSEGIHF